MANGIPAVPSGPVAQEFAEWLKAIRQGWTQSLKKPPTAWHQKRLMYACAGSFTWFSGTVTLLVLGDPRFLNFATGGLVSLYGVLGIVLLSFWFGWLVAFVDRNAGPIRLFLDGILLPTATLAIISLSAQKIRSIPAEPPASNGSAPISLGPSDAVSDEPRSRGESPPTARPPSNTEPEP